MEPFVIVLANAEHLVTNRFPLNSSSQIINLQQWTHLVVSFANSLHDEDSDEDDSDMTDSDSPSTPFEGVLPIVHASIPVNIFCENLHNCHRRLILHERRQNQVRVTVDPAFSPSSRTTAVSFSSIERYDPLQTLPQLELCGCTVTQYSTLEQLSVFITGTSHSLISRLKQFVVSVCSFS